MNLRAVGLILVPPPPIRCMIPFIENSKKRKLIYNDQKQTSGYLGMEAWA